MCTKQTHPMLIGTRKLELHPFCICGNANSFVICTKRKQQEPLYYTLEIEVLNRISSGYAACMCLCEKRRLNKYRPWEGEKKKCRFLSICKGKMEKGINDLLEKLRENPCYIKSKQNNCEIISSICPNRTILNDQKRNIYWKISSASSCFHFF